MLCERISEVQLDSTRSAPHEDNPSSCVLPPSLGPRPILGLWPLLDNVYHPVVSRHVLLPSWLPVTVENFSGTVTIDVLDDLDKQPPLLLPPL